MWTCLTVPEQWQGEIRGFLFVSVVKRQILHWREEEEESDKGVKAFEGFSDGRGSETVELMIEGVESWMRSWGKFQ